MEKKRITEQENLLSWIEEHRFSLTPYMPSEKIDHKGVWGGRVLDNLTKGIKNSEQSAIDLGCELIAKDEKYIFGKIIKSNIARALKNNTKYISTYQQQQIFRVTLKLLGMEYFPRETEDYCKLVSKFDISGFVKELDSIKTHSENADHWVSYLVSAAKNV